MIYKCNHETEVNEYLLFQVGGISIPNSRVFDPVWNKLEMILLGHDNDFKKYKA